MCQRLQPDDFEENLKVDVISPNGSINTIVHTAAHATISSLTTLRAPPLFTPENLKVGKTTAIVKVTEVMAPNVIIPGVKKHLTKSPCCLRDFGPVPFHVRVPYKMLRKQSACSAVVNNDRNFSQTQNTYDHSYITGPSSESNGITYTDANEMIDMVLDDINFENTDDAEEESPNDDDSPSIDDEDHSSLNQDDIELIRQLMHGNVMDIKNAVPFNHPKLSPPPSSIADKFSSVLGDGFHFMDRIKVPTNHCHKKSFYICRLQSLFKMSSKVQSFLKHCLHDFHFMETRYFSPF